jgi:hypothetical protein
MERLQSEIAEILSLLETIFPPSFFTINVHLMVHLPAQARMAGPIQFRSMWPVREVILLVAICYGIFHFILLVATCYSVGAENTSRSNHVIV